MCCRSYPRPRGIHTPEINIGKYVDAAHHRTTDNQMPKQRNNSGKILKQYNLNRFLELLTKLKLMSLFFRNECVINPDCLFMYVRSSCLRSFHWTLVVRRVVRRRNYSVHLVVEDVVPW